MAPATASAMRMIPNRHPASADRPMITSMAKSNQLIHPA